MGRKGGGREGGENAYIAFLTIVNFFYERSGRRRRNGGAICRRGRKNSLRRTNELERRAAHGCKKVWGCDAEPPIDSLAGRRSCDPRRSTRYASSRGRGVMGSVFDCSHELGWYVYYYEKLGIGILTLLDCAALGMLCTFACAMDLYQQHPLPSIHCH